MKKIKLKTKCTQTSKLAQKTEKYNKTSKIFGGSNELNGSLLCLFVLIGSKQFYSTITPSCVPLCS